MSSKDASVLNNMDIDSEDEWEEESTYMIMDLGSDLTIDLLKRSLEINNGYSIIGLDSDQPMFKIGNFVYKGEVDYSLGTDLIFEVDENKINKDKNNLESSIHPSNASLKQSSSVYSYLTGEDPSNTSQGLSLIPLTQTTKKMVFHSVLLEQKDDELSGKDKLPDSLLPNLSPNTLFMNKDAILNTMAVNSGDISPISVSGTTSQSKSLNSKLNIDNISLMDAVSDIVEKKSNENKINKLDGNIDLDSAETSQIFSPEISNIESTEPESNETSQMTINTESISKFSNEFDSNMSSQISNSGILDIKNNIESGKMSCISYTKSSEISNNSTSNQNKEIDILSKLNENKEIEKEDSKAIKYKQDSGKNIGKRKINEVNKLNLNEKESKDLVSDKDVSQSKEKSLPRRRRSSTSINVKKSNSTRGRKPKSSTKGVTSKKSGTLDKYLLNKK